MHHSKFKASLGNMNLSQRKEMGRKRREREDGGRNIGGWERERSRDRAERERERGGERGETWKPQCRAMCEKGFASRKQNKRKS